MDERSTLCPRGLKQVSHIACGIPVELRCETCGGFHQEDATKFYAQREAERESKNAELIETMARQMLIEMADIEPDLPLRNARNICRNLAQWAFDKGCRP